jgi:dolichyl-phosphate-mannose--protein O-mannosyl transferase
MCVPFLFPSLGEGIVSRMLTGACVGSDYTVPSGEMKFYRSPFLRDFWHLNVAMMTSNNALIPDPDKEDILASLPTDWPLIRLGLRMRAWVRSIT